MREGGEVKAGDKILSPMPGGMRVATVPNLRGQGWITVYLTLEEAGACFLGLVCAFKRIADGENPSLIFRAYPKAAFHGAIQKAERYAKTHKDAPQSLSMLGGMARRFESLCGDLTGGDDAKAKQARGEVWKAYADCWAHHALLSSETAFFFERETMRAEGNARVAKVRAQLAKVRGKKEEYRKWKRKTKTEREKARVLEAVRCVYKAGMTDEETAATLGISPRTVKSDLQTARAWGIAPPRTRGRRKRAEEDKTAPVAKAEQEEGEKYRWEHDSFFANLDGEGEE